MLGHTVLERVLQTQIERGAHHSPPRLDLGRKLADHPVDEMWRGERRWMQRRHHPLRRRARHLVVSDEAGLAQEAKHVLPPPQHRVRVPHRVVGGRRPRNHRQVRRLRNRQRRRRLAEVGPRRRLDPVGPVAVIRAVQVLLEDLALRHRPLEAERQDRFPDLVPQAARLADRAHHPHELHGQGRPAVRDAAAPQVEPAGAHEPHRVHAAVTEEALVLRDDDGEHDRRRDVVELHPGLAPRIGPRDRPQDVPLLVDDDQRAAPVAKARRVVGKPVHRDRQRHHTGERAQARPP